MARADGEDKIVPAAVACTLGSVTVPSLASVYNEFALKKHMDTSVHEQACSIYLAGCNTEQMCNAPGGIRLEVSLGQ